MEHPSSTVINSLFIYLRVCIITKAIFIQSNIKTYKIYSKIIKQNIDRVSVSFSSIYKVRVHDVLNVHVKSFYLHYIQNSQMSKGTVEHPSASIFHFWQK